MYGISGNTRAFWSLSNARAVLGYEPEDDSEVRFASDIQAFWAATARRVGWGLDGRNWWGSADGARAHIG